MAISGMKIAIFSTGALFSHVRLHKYEDGDEGACLFGKTTDEAPYEKRIAPGQFQSQGRRTQDVVDRVVVTDHNIVDHSLIPLIWHTSGHAMLSISKTKCKYHKVPSFAVPSIRHHARRCRYVASNNTLDAALPSVRPPDEIVICLAANSSFQSLYEWVSWLCVCSVLWMFSTIWCSCFA
jgi:hypothetical protein